MGINKTISEKFTEKPLIAYRRNPNLQQLIGGHRIENNKVVKRKSKIQGSCTPCNSKKGNKCCKQLKNTTTFKNRHTNREYQIFHRVNCKSKNVIYLLECRRCEDKAYVGKTEIPVNQRMNGHRSDARRTDKLAVDTHFLQPEHNFDRDARFTIIEMIIRKDLRGEPLTRLLEQREDFWILELATIEPKGFNIGLNTPN